MHHVRALKDIEKSNNFVQKYMSAIQRKQIPVCRIHHLELHKGNWSNKPTKPQMKPSSVGKPCDG